MEWQKTRAWVVLLPYILLVLGGLAVAAYHYIVPPEVIYQPGPTNVQKVYETKWKDRVKPELRVVPTNAKIEFFPQAALAKASKIKDAPDNVIAFGEVPKHTGKSTVFSTLNIGPDNVLRGGLEFRQEATPFWDFKREMGLRAGYGTGGIVGELYVRPLRMGPVDIEGRLRGRAGQDEKEFSAEVLADYHF